MPPFPQTLFYIIGSVRGQVGLGGGSNSGITRIYITFTSLRLGSHPSLTLTRTASRSHGPTAAPTQTLGLGAMIVFLGSQVHWHQRNSGLNLKSSNLNLKSSGAATATASGFFPISLFECKMPLLKFRLGQTNTSLFMPLLKIFVPAPKGAGRWPVSQAIKISSFYMHYSTK